MIKSIMILAFFLSSYGLFTSDVPIYPIKTIRWFESIKIASGIPLNEKWSWAIKKKYSKQIENKLKYYKNKKRHGR